MPNPPRRLFAYSGPAATLRALGQLRRGLTTEAAALHRACAARCIARLGVLAEQSPTWRVQGREIEVARLMRCVAEEVEAR